MNIKTSELCKIAKNTFGKYVYSKLEYTSPLLFLLINGPRLKPTGCKVKREEILYW
jgi:hypothetical protein